jgi:hypothetical protein
MHANYRHRLRRDGTIDEFQVNHRMPLMRIAFTARLDARLAADTPVWIDEKMVLAGFHGKLPVYC